MAAILGKMHTVFFLGVAVSILVRQAAGLPQLRQLEHAHEQTQRPNAVRSSELVKLKWSSYNQRIGAGQFQPVGDTSAVVQVGSVQWPPAAAAAPADATGLNNSGSIILPRTAFKRVMVPGWHWMLQQQNAYGTAAHPTSGRRKLRQLPAAETGGCKTVAADDETFITKCPGSAPTITDRSNRIQTQIAAKSGNSSGNSAQGCKAGTTCAVVLSAVLPVVAAIVGAAGGIWAACIRKKKKAQADNTT